MNSRHLARSNGTWRRRLCTKCSALFTTTEDAQYETLWTIKDSADGKLQPFNRDKLLLSIYDSCRHRGDGLKSATSLTDTVINKLLKQAKNGLLDKTRLMTTTHEVLKRFDKVAGVYYKAYNKL